MYFDYTIVLAFALVGLLFVIANLVAAARSHPRQAGEQPIDPPRVQVDGRHFMVALVAIVFAAGTLLLFPWALVLRDCLRDTGVAQSRGIGALALFEGVLFLGSLSIGLAYVWRSGDLDSISGYGPADPTADRKP